MQAQQYYTSSIKLKLCNIFLFSAPYLVKWAKSLAAAPVIKHYDEQFRNHSLHWVVQGSHKCEASLQMLYFPSKLNNASDKPRCELKQIYLQLLTKVDPCFNKFTCNYWQIQRQIVLQKTLKVHIIKSIQTLHKTWAKIHKIHM